MVVGYIGSSMRSENEYTSANGRAVNHLQWKLLFDYLHDTLYLCGCKQKEIFNDLHGLGVSFCFSLT